MHEPPPTLLPFEKVRARVFIGSLRDTSFHTVPRDSDHREQENRRFPGPSFNPAADDRQIIVPPRPEQAVTITIPRGPNIQPPPPQTALPGRLTGRVLIVVGDDISTGDPSPDGAEAIAFRSNVTAMATFVFRRIDPRFAARARESCGGFIVGGQNYGQGSSREHAALAPKQLGVTREAQSGAVDQGSPITNPVAEPPPIA
jgi:hypothetical protein